MARKKAKGKKPRFLEFSVPNVIQRPPGSTPADLVRALNAAVVDGELPAGWIIQQGWRNSKSKPFKFADVAQMAADSANRGGDFNGIYLHRYLQKRATHYGVRLRSAREATEEEEGLFEEEEEEIRERESGEFEELAKKQKRAAAAKRGAATRKAKRQAAEEERKRAAEERKRTFDKRAAAARKGWETRRRNAAKKAKVKNERT